VDPTPWLRRATRYLGGIFVVAIGAAVFAVAFRACLGAIYRRWFGVGDVVSVFTLLPPWARLVLPPAGAVIVGLIARVATRRSLTPRATDVMEAVATGRPLSLSATLLRSAASFCAIVSGASIGREGPLIQLGGALGGTVGRMLAIEPLRVTALVAAGTAAGFAAAYNTPFAAVLFVVEVVARAVALEVVLAAILATSIATAITRAAVGGGPIYGRRLFTLVSARELWAYALLGLVAALAAQVFMRMMSAGERVFARVSIPQPWRATVGGLAVGAIALWLPSVTGNGYEPINTILDGAMPVGLVAAVVAAKAFATTASVSSGSPGGVFTPTLLLGCGLGLCVQHGLAALVGPAALGGPGAYALVGMAALIAATTHAPLMAAVLVFELSGDYAIVLPLLIATSIATLLSTAMRADSIYAAEARRAAPQQPPIKPPPSASPA
jgi:CIC family chloride channel protein